MLKGIKVNLNFEGTISCEREINRYRLFRQDVGAAGLKFYEGQYCKLPVQYVVTAFNIFYDFSESVAELASIFCLIILLCRFLLLRFVFLYLVYHALLTVY